MAHCWKSHVAAHLYICNRLDKRKIFSGQNRFEERPSFTNFTGDGNVTEAEFVELWKALTGQTTELANSYFHLADITDDKIINQNDYSLLYRVFDLNGKIQNVFIFQIIKVKYVIAALRYINRNFCYCSCCVRMQTGFTANPDRGAYKP